MTELQNPATTYFYELRHKNSKPTRHLDLHLPVARGLRHRHPEQGRRHVLGLPVAERNLTLLTVAVAKEHGEQRLPQVLARDQPVHQVEVLTLRHLVERQTENTVKVERTERVVSFIRRSHEVAPRAGGTDA